MYSNCIQNVQISNGIRKFQCSIWKLSYSVVLLSVSEAWFLASVAGVSPQDCQEFALPFPCNSRLNGACANKERLFQNVNFNLFAD